MPTSQVLIGWCKVADPFKITYWFTQMSGRVVSRSLISWIFGPTHCGCCWSKLLCYMLAIVWMILRHVARSGWLLGSITIQDFPATLQDFVTGRYLVIRFFGGHRSSQSWLQRVLFFMCQDGCFSLLLFSDLSDSRDSPLIFHDVHGLGGEVCLESHLIHVVFLKFHDISRSRMGEV